MNIVIVGGGVVGTATGLGFQRLGHDVRVMDVRDDCLAATKGLSVTNAPPYPSPTRQLTDLDVVFFCVPEAQIDEATESVHQIVIPGPSTSFYIRSSVPVGTCKRLTKKYGRCIGHNAEFLREAVAEYEFLNPPAVILGDCCPEHGQFMESLYRPLRVPIHHTTPEVSELTKLAVNGYLACQVSWWNQLKLLADALGVNSHEVGMLAAHCDDRVSVYGARMHGRPYGGSCLPKDLRQLIDLCAAKGVSAPLFQAVAIINRRMGSESEAETWIDTYADASYVRSRPCPNCAEGWIPAGSGAPMCPTCAMGRKGLT